MNKDRKGPIRFKMLLIDEPSPFREMLKTLLQTRFKNSAIDAIETIAEGQFLPDSTTYSLLLINIHLANGKGLELARQIKIRHPDLVILALVDHDLPEYRVAVRRSGIDYYIPKDQWSSKKTFDLIESILMCPEGV